MTNKAIVPTSSDSDKFTLEYFQDKPYRFQDRSPWLTQKEMAALFNLDVRTISYHVGEFKRQRGERAHQGIQKFWIPTSGGSQEVEHYNISVITYTGYRAQQTAMTLAIQDWVEEILKRYVSGEIRAIEQSTYKRLLECFAQAVDYNPKRQNCRNFFSTTQNKIYFAIIGKTAAEVIADRADHRQNNMGLHYWSNQAIRKSDISIAKNYLTLDELSNFEVVDQAIFNVAKMLSKQIHQGKPATISEFVGCIDLQILAFRMEVLKSNGHISHAEAEKIANEEYKLFNQRLKREGLDNPLQPRLL